ncbi:MAG TPA: Ig-like domain-containing protein, partial [Thermoanaerobaculia bacterium]
PSATARATFPQTSTDTTPPTVAFVAPVSGAQLTGNVQIVVDASDDRGLNFVEVQYQPNMGQPRICSAAGGGALTYRLSCTWNTSNLAPGSYELTAYASDTIGNYKTQTINVTVGSTAAPSVRVSAITLSASTRKVQTTVNGVVKVVNQAGAAVQGAGVSVVWATPTGPISSFANTDRKGLASFTVQGGTGTFSLTVDSVVLTGHVFDAERSELSATIVVR